MFEILPTQATASSVARTLVSAGLAGRARSIQKNPEEFIEKHFVRKGYGLPLKPELIEHEGDKPIPTWYLSPQVWMKWILSTQPELLTGLGDSAQNLHYFWSAFRFGHAHHQIFNSHLEGHLSRTIPYLLHGDEGRGLKKGKAMVMSMQSPLGSTARAHTRDSCDCGDVLGRNPNLPTFGGDFAAPYSLPPKGHKVLQNQHTNYCGSTFLSRWLFFTLGSWVYVPYPEVLENLVDRLATDLRRLFHEGVEVGNQRFFAACIGVKGDLDWHRQVYQLLRSYAHVGTRWTGSICHACLAGGQGPMFEDYSERPAWMGTAFVQRPWDPLAEPPLTRIPAFAAPEELIALDPFHVVKMGFGRAVAGGVLVYLARKACFDFPGSTQNFSDRLNRAHGSFSLFCIVQKKHPSLRSFSKAFLNMKSFASAPWSNTKGSDTMLVLSWLAWFLKLMLQNPPAGPDVDLLRCMLRLCEATIAAMRILHTHRLWLDRLCARRLYIELMRMLRGYQLAGSRCLSSSYRAFIQKPKNHALHHIAFNLRAQLLTGAPYILNPECYSCEPCEDFIGRISRISRRVDVRKQGNRVFTRVFFKIRAVHKRWRKSRKIRA